MTTRAERRARSAAIRAKRMHTVSWVRVAAAMGNGKAAAIAANTPTPCSCHLCGNVRAHHGRTLQERRAGWR